MIREWIKCAGERIEDRLRRVCGAMNPDIRVYAIVTLFVLFAALSLYSTVSAIYSLGRNDGERIRIEHLQRLAPQPGHKQESFGNSDAMPQPEAAFPAETERTQSGADSPERLNTTDYERERETRQ